MAPTVQRACAKHRVLLDRDQSFVTSLTYDFPKVSYFVKLLSLIIPEQTVTDKIVIRIIIVQTEDYAGKLSKLLHYLNLIWKSHLSCWV